MKHAKNLRMMRYNGGESAWSIGMFFNLAIWFTAIGATALTGCGSDDVSNPPAANPQPEPTSEPNENGGGEAAAWFSVSESVACIQSFCPGKRGFQVRSDARYFVGGVEQGSLSAQEFQRLITDANAVAVQDLSSDLICARPGAGFAPDGHALTIRVDQSSSARLVYENSTEGGRCYRGNVNLAQNLESYFYSLVRKYDNEPRVCTQIFVYGLNITVQDDQGRPIPNATVVARAGNYVETLERSSDGQYLGAGERSGTYSIVVSAPGFQNHQESELRVNRDPCHVVPVRRTITLQASSQ